MTLKKKLKNNGFIKILIIFNSKILAHNNKFQSIKNN